MNIRICLVISLILVYIVLGIIDIKNGNMMTGIASLGLSLVNGCLFLGAK